MCPRSPPADADRADRARGDDGDGADRGGDDRGQGPPDDGGADQIAAGGAEGDEHLAIVRLAPGLAGDGLGDEEGSGERGDRRTAAVPLDS